MLRRTRRCVRLFWRRWREHQPNPGVSYYFLVFGFFLLGGGVGGCYEFMKAFWCCAWRIGGIYIAPTPTYLSTMVAGEHLLEDWLCCLLVAGLYLLLGVAAV